MDFVPSDILYTILVVIACLAIWYGPGWLGIAIVSVTGFFLIKSTYCIIYSMMDEMEELLFAHKKQAIMEKVNGNNQKDNSENN